MKTLAVHYFYSDITGKLAEDIVLLIDGESRELKPKKPYSYSYSTAMKEVRREIEKEYCLSPAEGAEPVGDAELTLVGSSNWLHTLAPSILPLLRVVNLSGKTIIPSYTHGGDGFGDMLERYQEERRAPVIRDGIVLKGDYNFDELQTRIEHSFIHLISGLSR